MYQSSPLKLPGQWPVSGLVHTQAGAVCMTSSPRCSMDGKHLEACSKGIKDFYTPRMGGGGSLPFQ